MFENRYGDNRILIVTGKYEGISKKTCDYLYGEIAPEVPYILTVCEADNLTEEQKKYYNIVAVGTKENNSYIAELCNKGLISIPDHPEGYRIKVFDNPDNPERQIFAIAGGGNMGAYYGVSHFVNSYLPKAECRDLHKVHLTPIFDKKMLEIDIEEVPQIKERGVWTWGHVIYDYKRLIDNMAKLRMNMITIWNDFAPINAKDIVDYAHFMGVKITWGFSMGWGYDFDISDEAALQKIIDDAMDNYEKNYSHLGGDGIYFQTFTETHDANKNGVSIAEAVANFVNKISENFRARFGDMRIQFGLHATSVKNNLKDIGKVCGDVEIVWEDGGCYPYEYSPENLIDYEGTKALTENITTLRGENERFAVVLKGLQCLEWSKFEHQMSTYDMGVYSRRNVADRYATMRKFWRRVNTFWIKNGDKAREIIEIIRKDTKGNTMIEALIEDGLMEEKINLACAIYAQLIWNSNRPYDEIVYEACLMPDMDMQKG